MLDEAAVACPYCGEKIALLVDCSVGDSDYIEDCAICCRPMRVALRTDAAGALAGITLATEDD